MQILDGKMVSEELAVRLKKRVYVLKKAGVIPKLVFFLIGGNGGSIVYVTMKQKFCVKVGVESEIVRLPHDAPQEAVMDLIGQRNSDPKVHGIMVQLRVPEHLDEQAILQAIDPTKDVDGLCEANQSDPIGNGRFAAATPKGVMTLLNYYGLSLTGKRVVTLGRTNLFGIPFRRMVEAVGGQVTAYLGRDWREHLREIAEADVVVSALGGGRVLITPDMVKDGAICVDVGLGPDFAFEEFVRSDKEGWITPTKGGTGPMTVYSIVENCILSAERTLEV